MQKYILIAAILWGGISVAAEEAETDSARVVIETRQLAPYENIRVARGINVTLVDWDEPKAEIHIQNADPEDVIIEQSHKDLTIRMRTRIYRDMAVNVYLYYQDIKEISAGTGGSVYSDDIVVAETLSLDAGSDASIQFEVEVGHLEASVSAGRIELMGTANSIDVNVTTGGRFVGANLESINAVVRATTAANAQVWVTGELEARAGTGGRIEYTGNPERINSSTSFGGRVNEFEE